MKRIALIMLLLISSFVFAQFEISDSSVSSSSISFVIGTDDLVTETNNVEAYSISFNIDITGSGEIADVSLNNIHDPTSDWYENTNEYTPGTPGLYEYVVASMDPSDDVTISTDLVEITITPVSSFSVGDIVSLTNITINALIAGSGSQRYPLSWGATTDVRMFDLLVDDEDEECWLIDIAIDNRVPGLESWSDVLHIGMLEGYSDGRDLSEYRLPPPMTEASENEILCYVQKPEEHPDSRSDWSDDNGFYIDDIIGCYTIAEGNCETWFHTVEKHQSFTNEFTLNYDFSEVPSNYTITISKLRSQADPTTAFDPKSYSSPFSIVNEDYDFSDWDGDFAYFLISVCYLPNVPACFVFCADYNFVGIPGIPSPEPAQISDIINSPDALHAFWHNDDGSRERTMEMQSWEGYWVENLSADQFKWCRDEMGTWVNADIGTHHQLKDGPSEIGAFSIPYLPSTGHIVWSTDPDRDDLIFYDGSSNSPQHGVGPSSPIVTALHRWSCEQWDLNGNGPFAGWVMVYDEASGPGFENVVYPYLAYTVNCISNENPIEISFGNPTAPNPSLVVPNTPNREAHSQSSEKWEMSITCVNDNACDFISKIGVDQSATGVSNYEPHLDYFEPERMSGEYISLYFPHNYPGIDIDKFNWDIQSPIFDDEIREWNFNVESSDDYAILGWKHPDTSSVNIHLFLKDMQTGHITDMLQENFYDYDHPAGNPAHFKIFAHGPISNWDFVIYPNPFRDIVTIEYSVRENSKVDLSVYNLMGHRIANLVDREQELGNYSVKWSPSNDISSGLYFVVLKIDNQVKVKKCVNFN